MASTSKGEPARSLIREVRTSTQARLKPSEIFECHFGESNGVELPARESYAYKPLVFSEEDKE